MIERLQKYLASCGIASRRECEKIIQQGRVQVNGVTASIGDKVDDECDTVLVDNKQAIKEENKYYIMLNKPRGVVATAKDERNRETVIDIINRDISARIFPVGRLDINTEGLLLLTNDGEFANKITHPSNKIAKTYLVRIKGGLIKKEEVYSLRKGVMLDDGQTKPAKVDVKEFYPDNTTLLQITIYEGRNRQIRRMCEAVGHSVVDLMRTEIGGIKLGNLPYGKWRHLKDDEIKILMNTSDKR